ncbi:hypothetical protein CVS40_12694 [Lucilia cuprina]|nr:hypothetical protein CVS40_12694 [Lucilia cuprina]
MIEMVKNQNDILQKRLNHIIVINGLPKNQPNVINVVQNIFKHLNVHLIESDINVCFFINNGNSVLVKLNSMFKRDAIMNNYFKTRTLKLSDVIDTDIQKRIFLNDHLTPRA